MKKGLIVAIIVGVIFGIGQSFYTTTRTDKVNRPDSFTPKDIQCAEGTLGCGMCPESYSGNNCEFIWIRSRGLPLHFAEHEKNAMAKDLFNMLFFVMVIPLIYILIRRVKKSRG